ncbi:endonuclease/exonuclease/phosphatase family protein [Longispora albida]|uniref:endonuclease/exonuclease/phosphatase family protein n=1 Tax=Longispora albida TaxID=203523 RepID=UPI00037D93D0|nr:endonuclease/exonuclease/phosphatase family protein [Longispora albida]
MTTLRVVSYNIHSRRDDQAALARVVRALNPDVLFVQEAARRFRWRHHCAELARGTGLYYASGGLPGLGNLILVSLRVSVHEAWGMRFPLTPGRHMRGAAFARCSVGGRPFVAAGTHLSTDDAERPSQAVLLAAALSELNGGPLLFGADFNETDGGSAWRTLADGRIDPGAAEQAHTYSVGNPRRRIDGLLIDPECAVSGYQVVTTPDTALASDHFPVYAEVSLPER